MQQMIRHEKIKDICWLVWGSVAWLAGSHSEVGYFRRELLLKTEDTGLRSNEGSLFRLGCLAL